jgi:hypothetical protein
MSNRDSRFSLPDALPDFARELEALLLAANQPLLAAQVTELMITRRCSCEDDFCATFYTHFEPDTKPYPDNRTLELDPKDGMILVDVASGRIAGVEVLYRDDVRRSLRELFP